MQPGNTRRRGSRAAAAAIAVLILAGMNLGCPRRDPVTAGNFAHRLYRYQIQVGGEKPWYIVYVPDNYDPATPTPLILYWHGLFQAGTDGAAPYRDGIGLALDSHPELYPCLVALPQLPYFISIEDGNAIFNAVLEQLKQDYSVDPERIYVAGASTGSIRAMHYVIDTPDIFAGLFAIAGSVDVEYAPMLTDIPIFIAHGDADPATPVQTSRDLVDAIRELGGTVEYVEIPGADHQIFYMTYSRPSHVNWLLSQRLNP